ncbi:hypothetical protein SNE40_001267 [Patella caerulea]|uniref:Uncharacterized protein n=1 Tax=Patella caerulea TaxID=87958 RepID=A0AAN8KDN7_PATCE
MSFHLRVFQHNFRKFSRLRTVAYSIECGGNKSDSVSKETDAQDGLSCKLGKIWPEENLVENLPVLLITKPQTSLAVQTLTATQSLPGHYNDHTNEKCLVPLNKSDIERLLRGAVLSNSERIDSTHHLLDCIKPYSYTTDDIYIVSPPTSSSAHKVNYNMLSDSVISQENISVTFTDQDNFSKYCAMDDIKSDNSILANDNIMLCSAGQSKGEKNSNATKGTSLPSVEQLEKMKEALTLEVQKFFKHKLDYGILHPNVILENNFWGKEEISEGINRYAIQMLKFRAISHCVFTTVVMQVLSISSNRENGTITLKWRVRGLPQLYIFYFWRYTPWTYRKNLENDMKWHDGISVFTLKSDGLIHKHRIDRVQVDEEPLAVKKKTLATKLALLVGLSPKPSLNDFSSFFMKKSYLNPK